jgi:hypothetical protein
LVICDQYTHDSCPRAEGCYERSTFGQRDRSDCTTLADESRAPVGA